MVSVGVQGATRSVKGLKSAPSRLTDSSRRNFGVFQGRRLRRTGRTPNEDNKENPRNYAAWSVLSPCTPTLLFYEIKKPLDSKGFSNCGRWDLNPHDRIDHKILSLARLPVPTLPHDICCPKIIILHHSSNVNSFY